jgi:AcrR family transcriptional regulator
MRADAQHNRERILEVAVRAFSREGPDVSLNAIAKEAGVGPGTLYRHFPTREALIDAAYRNELARLSDSAAGLLRDMPPDKALRVWMDSFTGYIATKRGMDGALRALIASGGNPFSESRERLTTAIRTLLGAGVADGTLRPDVTPEDVLFSLSGITLATSDHVQTGRLLDLLMDGLRAR